MSIGPLALKNNLNELKKLNTTSMTNGSSEFIQFHKKGMDKSEKSYRSNINVESPRNKPFSTQAVDTIQIKLEVPIIESKPQINENKIKENGGENQKKDENIKEPTAENILIENNEKLKEKKSKQVAFAEKDKVITVDNWKKYNMDKKKICRCNII